MKLSVLDQSVALHGSDEGAALRDTLALAPHCEALGYHRFWVSEHHSLPTIVGSAPEVLLAAVAARTRHMRIGSAGVMLPHYSAYKVAEQFRVLEALAPGRVDLGVGRAPGGDRRTAQALNPHADGTAENFPAQVRELQAWLEGQAPSGVVAHPRGPSCPDVWMLGSSDYGAQLAAYFGLPYAFAYFFTDGVGVEQALDLYRTQYRPSQRHPRPQATICVWALADESDEAAQHHATSRERWRVDRAAGRLGPLLSPQAVAERGFTTAEWSSVLTMRRKAFVGSAARVAEQLQALAGQLELDEIVINTWAHDPQVRRRSYALLAQACGLEPLPPEAPEALPPPA